MNRAARRRASPERFALLLSCEHASAAIPANYRQLFHKKAAQNALASHRGIDLGAKRLAKFLAAKFTVPLHEGSMSRLLIDLNRSARHPLLFSEFSRSLSVDQRETLRDFHQRYQERVRRDVEKLAHHQPVLHVAVHSFTPHFYGIDRKTDIGLLFDPARDPEKTLAHALQRHLRLKTNFTIHRNAPYRGIADGLPTILRKEFAPEAYSGIELEVNQRLLDQPATRLYRQIAEAIEYARQHVESTDRTRTPRTKIKKA